MTDYEKRMIEIAGSQLRQLELQTIIALENSKKYCIDYERRFVRMGINTDLAKYQDLTTCHNR